MFTVSAPVYGKVHIPEWASDLEGFRRWVRAGPLPDKLKVSYLAGEVWVDVHMEEAFSHNLVKSAVTAALVRVAEEADSGVVFSDRMRLTHPDADLSTEPDVMYVSDDTLDAGRARFTAGETGDAEATELVGSPDLVVEIVSPSSEDKDTETLFSQYYDAGVAEYWLIDARGADIRFDVYRRGPKGYRTTRKSAGWVKSGVLGRSFRLVRVERRPGVRSYTVEVR